MKAEPFSPTPIAVVINGRKVETNWTTLSYQQIVELAETQWGNDALHSVTFHHKVPFEQLPGERDGSLTPGQVVRVTPGMVISAAVTGSA